MVSLPAPLLVSRITMPSLVSFILADTFMPRALIAVSKSPTVCMDVSVRSMVPVLPALFVMLNLPRATPEPLFSSDNLVLSPMTFGSAVEKSIVLVIEPSMTWVESLVVAVSSRLRSAAVEEPFSAMVSVPAAAGCILDDDAVAGLINFG